MDLHYVVTLVPPLLARQQHAKGGPQRLLLPELLCRLSLLLRMRRVCAGSAHIFCQMDTFVSHAPCTTM